MFTTVNTYFNEFEKINYNEYLAPVKSFGHAVKLFRKSRGLTQEALARLIGGKQNYITRVETGEFDNPTKDTIEKFAKALGVSPSDFLETNHYIEIVSQPPEDLYTDEEKKLVSEWRDFHEKEKVVMKTMMKALKLSRDDESHMVSERVIAKKKVNNR